MTGRQVNEHITAVCEGFGTASQRKTFPLARCLGPGTVFCTFFGVNIEGFQAVPIFRLTFKVFLEIFVGDAGSSSLHGSSPGAQQYHLLRCDLGLPRAMESLDLGATTSARNPTSQAGNQPLGVLNTKHCWSKMVKNWSN